MIVVVDANVWIAMMQFPGPHSTPRKAIEHALVENVVVTCVSIEAEIRRVLTEKFRWSAERCSEQLKPYRVGVACVETIGTVKFCRDPKDDMVLECAERASADLIVTGDKDLLVLGRYGKTRIVTPAQYLACEQEGSQ